MTLKLLRMRCYTIFSAKCLILRVFFLMKTNTTLNLEAQAESIINRSTRRTTKDKMVRHKRGSLHQGNVQFCPFNGVQCTAIAFLALVVFQNMSFHSPHTWVQDITSIDIDNLVIQGSSLYGYISRTRGIEGYLAHTDIPSSINDWIQGYPHYEIQTDNYFGTVSGYNNRDFGENDLRLSFTQASLISPYLLFTSGGTTICIVCDNTNEQYLIFDSHARNANGYPDANGNSILLIFDQMEEVLEYLTNMYNGHRYEISNVNFENHFHTLPDKMHNYAKQKHQSKEVNKKLFKKPKLSKLTSNNIDLDWVHESESELNIDGDANLNHDAIHTDFFDISETCTVETHYPSQEFINNSKHNSNYELHIRQMPSLHCESCERILFPEQKVCLYRLTEKANFYKLTTNSSLCRYCHSRIKENKDSAINSKHNNLDVGIQPLELKGLSLLEKRMISLIQIFMSIHILPGGQYAEKGLILNLPSNIQDIANQLPRHFNDDYTLSVHFLHNEPVVTHRHFVNCKNIKSALLWLTQNNPLYQNIKLDDCIDRIEHTSSELLDPYESSSLLDSNLEQSSMTPLDVNAPLLNSSFMTEGTIKVPSSNSQPVNTLDLVSGEEMAFPWLFPFGINGFKHPREVHINPSMYFKHRLYNKNPQFRRNLTYLLHSCVSYNMSLLKNEIGIYMRICNNKGDRITANDVQSPGSFSQNLFENSYMFMKNIKGTVAYFRNALYNLLSMLRYLGPPTIFMTLSADDNHWTELGMCLNNLTYEDAYAQSTFSSNMREDPLMTSIHFNRRFKFLLNDIILKNEMPFGQVTDYFGRIEFQNRGSPHIHMFLWVKDFPTEINSQNKQFFIDYIDKTIHANIPHGDSELKNYVTRFQTHSHSKYCQKGHSKCRFKFPHPVSSETSITHVNDMSSSNKGKFYVLQRNENSSYINPYNPVVLRHWRANMDVQLVCNAEGVAYYVCSYLCKSEPDDLRCAIGNLIQNVFKQNPGLPKHRKLFQIGLCVFKHRRISSQEAAFRLGDLNLLHTSRSFTSINTRLPEKRFRLLKSTKEIGSLDKNSTDIFHSNMLDYYHNRPSIIENMSYFRFSSLYIKAEPLKCHRSSNERIYISKYDIYMKAKKVPTIVRYTNLPLNSDEHFYSLLLLLLPHRNEQELVEGFSNAKDAFIAKKQFFNNSVPFERFSFVERVENLLRHINVCEKEIEQSSPVHNSSEEINDQYVQLLENMNGESECPQQMNAANISNTLNISNTNDLFSGGEEMYLHSLECSMSIEEYNDKKGQLSTSQSFALKVIENHFNRQETTPLHLFITGGAGTGKSYLTKLIIGYLQLFTSNVLGSNPVIVCAPTGTAAHIIGGSTIHSALAIPVSEFNEYLPLSSYMLSKLRNRYVNVHSMIIDEVSMVSDTMLTYISRRLSDIKHNSSPFGGLNVFVIGDLFQLRPVRASFVFKNLLLWQLFKPIFLRQNMRQASDSAYAQLLNRARVGLLSHVDVSSLKKRIICSNDVEFKSALRVFPTRAKVHEFNENEIINLHEEVVILTAIHLFGSKDPNSGANVPNSLIPSDDSDAGGLPSSLRISINSRVMLIRNINTLQGLVNGAMGVVESFTYDENKVQKINVKFDNLKKTHNDLTSENNAIAIEQYHHEFIRNGRHIVRSQFPLILCFACTIHKVQGMSLDKVVIDIGNGIFERGMSYVALSRVTSLDGLGILEFDPKNILPHDQVIEEHERLQKNN